MSEIIKNDKNGRQEIISMVKDLSNYFNDVRSQLSLPYGLSLIQSIIVLDVYHNPKENKITDICRRLNKSTNTISPLVNRLVSKGFLEKVRSTEDGRIAYVYLTEKTNKIIESFNVDLTDYVWPMFDSLTEEEFVNIYNSLKKLIEVASK